MDEKPSTYTMATTLEREREREREREKQNVPSDDPTSWID